MAKYKIWDLQNGGYKSGGAVFDSLEDVRENLISYHSIDWGGEDDIDDMSLVDMLEYGEWAIHDENGNELEINNL